MAKKAVEEQLDFTVDSDMSIDTEEIKNVEPEKTAVHYEDERIAKFKKQVVKTNTEDEPLINCLKSEIITVKHLQQPGTISDPRHVLSGGMAETAKITISVPRYRTGGFVDVLTKSEKKYLEYILGLEDGALSVYNRTNNFWDNTTEGGVSKVILTKYDTKLDLSDPIQYILYKILLANKELICPDPLTLADRPKATYKFVLISDKTVSSMARTKMSIKQQCWIEFGKIESNKDILRAVIETITSKPLSPNTDLDFLQTKAGELIDADSKLFLSVIKDEYLNTRVLIKKCLEHGFLYKKGDWIMLRSDNSPLCGEGEEPTMTVAARYLNDPRHQEMRMLLEAKVK